MRSPLPVVVALALVGPVWPGHAAAQDAPAPERAPRTPPPAAAPTPAAAPRPEERRPPAQLVNVRVDLTVTDQKGSEPPVSKALTLTLADRENGMVRSTVEVAPPQAGIPRPVALNVDAHPEIVDGGKIRLRLSLNYGFVDRSAQQLPTTEVRQSLEVVLESGKPMVVAQSADPVADRKTTLEVKATILR